MNETIPGSPRHACTSGINVVESPGDELCSNTNYMIFFEPVPPTSYYIFGIPGDNANMKINRPPPPGDSTK